MEELITFGLQDSIYSPDMSFYKNADLDMATRIRKIVQEKLVSNITENSIQLYLLLRDSRNFYPVTLSDRHTRFYGNNEEANLMGDIFLHFSVREKKLYALSVRMKVKVSLCWRQHCKKEVTSINSSISCDSCHFSQPAIESSSLNFSLKEIREEVATKLNVWKNCLAEQSLTLTEAGAKYAALLQSIFTCITDLKISTKFHPGKLSGFVRRRLAERLTQEIYSLPYVKLSYDPERECFLYMFPDDSDWVQICNFPDCYGSTSETQKFCAGHCQGMDLEEDIRQADLELE